MNAIAKKRCTPLKVFLGFSLLNLALFLLLIPFLGQKGFDWVVFSLAVLVQAFLTDDMKTIPRFLGFFLLGFCIVLAPIFLYLSVKGIIPGFIQTYFLFNFEYSGDAGAKASIWTAIRFMAHEWMFPSLVAAFLWAVQEKGKGNIYWKAMVVFPYPVAAHVCHERKQLSILSHLNDPLLRGTAGEGSGYRVRPSAYLFASASGGRDGGSLRGELVYAASHGGKPVAPRHPGNRPRR